MVRRVIQAENSGNNSVCAFRVAIYAPLRGRPRGSFPFTTRRACLFPTASNPLIWRITLAATSRCMPKVINSCILASMASSVGRPAESLCGFCSPPECGSCSTGSAELACDWASWLQHRIGQIQSRTPASGTCDQSMSRNRRIPSSESGPPHLPPTKSSWVKGQTDPRARASGRRYIRPLLALPTKITVRGCGANRCALASPTPFLLPVPCPYQTSVTAGLSHHAHRPIQRGANLGHC